VLLNIIGLATLIVIDGPTAFMNTPSQVCRGGMDLKTFIETTADAVGQDEQLQLVAAEQSIGRSATSSSAGVINRPDRGLHVSGCQDRRGTSLL